MFRIKEISILSKRLCKGAQEELRKSPVPWTTKWDRTIMLFQDKCDELRDQLKDFVSVDDTEGANALEPNSKQLAHINNTMLKLFQFWYLMMKEHKLVYGKYIYLDDAVKDYYLNRIIILKQLQVEMETLCADHKKIITEMKMNDSTLPYEEIPTFKIEHVKEIIELLSQACKRLDNSLWPTMWDLQIENLDFECDKLNHKLEEYLKKSSSDQKRVEVIVTEMHHLFLYCFETMKLHGVGHGTYFMLDRAIEIYQDRLNDAISRLQTFRVTLKKAIMEDQARLTASRKEATQSLEQVKAENEKLKTYKNKWESFITIMGDKNLRNEEKFEKLLSLKKDDYQSMPSCRARMFSGRPVTKVEEIEIPTQLKPPVSASNKN